MISLRSPPDATLEESSPGFSKFACSVEDSAGAAVKVALTGWLFGAKRFVRARLACEFEVEPGLFCPSHQVKTWDEGCFAYRDRKVECLKAKAKNFGRKQSQIVLFLRVAIGNMLTRMSHWQAWELQNFRMVEVTNFAIQLGMRHRTFTRPFIVRVLSQGKPMKNTVLQNRTCT